MDEFLDPRLASLEDPVDLFCDQAIHGLLNHSLELLERYGRRGLGVVLNTNTLYRTIEDALTEVLHHRSVKDLVSLIPSLMGVVDGSQEGYFGGTKILLLL